MDALLPSFRVSLLTGGIEKHYPSELSTALAAKGVSVDVICDTDMDTPEMRGLSKLRLLPLYHVRWPRNPVRKLLSCLRVYGRLIRYTAKSSAPIIHILWNYKIPAFDRTMLLFYYKLLGKQVVFTAHNVNAAERDGVDSWWNRWTLRIQYTLVDRIVVHTALMKKQLQDRFGVSAQKIAVIPHGVHSLVPNSSLTTADARRQLCIEPHHRTVLFFGRIVPYKGIHYLVQAFESLALRDPSYRLLIAGEPMRESEQQWNSIRSAIGQSPMREQVIQHIRYIEDNDIELYFKAADVLILPYTGIFQSGVLFMSYSFGLPVIATDVGSFAEDIVPGSTGFLCRPQDPADLARTIEAFFSSDLFVERDKRRSDIQRIIRETNSWDIVAGKTADAYAAVSQPRKLQANA